MPAALRVCTLVGCYARATVWLLHSYDSDAVAAEAIIIIIIMLPIKP
jgi:hypothetical protein